MRLNKFVSVHSDANISSASQCLIEGLLVLRPDNRLTGENLFLLKVHQFKKKHNFELTATQVRERVGSIIFGRPQVRNLDQFVPTLPSDEVKKSKEKPPVNRVSFFSQ